jgi:hypothetical protein
MLNPTSRTAPFGAIVALVLVTLTVLASTWHAGADGDVRRTSISASGIGWDTVPARTAAASQGSGIGWD